MDRHHLVHVVCGSECLDVLGALGLDRSANGPIWPGGLFVDLLGLPRLCTDSLRPLQRCAHIDQGLHPCIRARMARMVDSTNCKAVLLYMDDDRTPREGLAFLRVCDRVPPIRSQRSYGKSGRCVAPRPNGNSAAICPLHPPLNLPPGGRPLPGRAMGSGSNICNRLAHFCHLHNGNYSQRHRYVDDTCSHRSGHWQSCARGHDDSRQCPEMSPI